MYRKFAAATLWILALCGNGSVWAALPIAVVDEANFFELAGKATRITYTTSAVSGEPQLTFQKAGQVRNFRGSEVRIAPGELGQTVTVTLEQIPDLRTVTLTLLIPDVHLSDSSPVLFRTEAITTTSRTTIGGPALVKGPVQSYEFLMLRGKASLIGNPPSATGVVGEVSLAPTCPGPQRQSDACTQPYANATVQLLDTTSNAIVARTSTNAQGLFMFDVSPGDYLVHVVVAGALPRCPDTRVTVASGTSNVNVVCDTGIR